MSFSSAQLARFSRQTTAHRAEAFAGALEPDGTNILIGERRLRLAFERHDAEVEIIEEGYRYEASATLQLPTAHIEDGITLAENSTLTHLPTGEVYRVTALVKYPSSGYTKYLLRREE